MGEDGGLRRDVSETEPAQVVAAAALPIDQTGVPNLDLVLGGGLRRGSLVLVVGPPGSGKTTLAGQMAFAAAGAGRRVLMIAALSEPVTKLLGHLRTFGFYDPALVGDQLRVHSLQQFLPQGLASTARELVQIVRAERAGLVVLDGFGSLRDVDRNPQAARAFLYDLSAALSIQGATTAVTVEGRATDPSFYRDATTADVIVNLEVARDNVRAQRWLEVVKARGTAPVGGRHGLTIDGAGATVRPRLEARATESLNGLEEPVEAGPAPSAVRAAFGLPELDAILGGGLPRETATLVLGGVGTGKTLLGLSFALAGAAADEPTLFLSLRENRRQLLSKADAFGHGAALRTALAPGGNLTLLRRPPVELDVERLADELLAEIDRAGARRLVIDSIAEWERAVGEGSDPRRISNHLAALVEVLHLRQMTALVIREVDGLVNHDGELAAETLPALVENVARLYRVVHRGRTHRVLSLPKLRGDPPEPEIYEFVLAPGDGFRVLGAFRVDGGVLDAIAEQEVTSGPGGAPPPVRLATPAIPPAPDAPDRTDGGHGLGQGQGTR